MKSPGAVKHKLNQVRFRYQKRRIEEELRVSPDNCAFNAKMPDDGMSLCLDGAAEPASWKATFCDERLDGGARAKTCGRFCPRRTKEQVKQEFQRELETYTLGDVAYHYPDMAALIWVLGDEDVPAEPLPEGAATPVGSPPARQDSSPSADEVTHFAGCNGDPRTCMCINDFRNTGKKFATPPAPVPTAEMEESRPPTGWWTRFFKGLGTW